MAARAWQKFQTDPLPLFRRIRFRTRFGITLIDLHCGTRLWRRVKHVLYHRIAATGGFFVAESLDVMWPAIQKPKTLKELQKEIPSSGDVGRRLAMAEVAEDYEAAMLSANLLEYMLKQGNHHKVHLAWE